MCAVKPFCRLFLQLKQNLSFACGVLAPKFWILDRNTTSRWIVISINVRTIIFCTSVTTIIPIIFMSDSFILFLFVIFLLWFKLFIIILVRVNLNHSYTFVLLVVDVIFIVFYLFGSWFVVLYSLCCLYLRIHYFPDVQNL